MENPRKDPILGLLEDRCRRDLAALAAGPPPTLTLLSGPADDLVEAAATALGGFWIPKAHRGIDLVVATADGRWDFAQLREKVIGPAKVAALNLRVIIVAGVEGIERDGYDLLLKTVEEPAPGTVFVFCAGSADVLPRTILGRVGASVHVEMRRGASRAEMLVEAGWTQRDAKRTQDLVIPARWYQIVGERPEVLDAFEMLQTTAMGGGANASVALDAASVCAEIEKLSEVAVKIAGGAEGLQRAARRSLIEWLLGRISSLSAETLASGSDPDIVEEVLAAIRAARSQLATNASFALVVSVLFERIAAARSTEPA